MFYGTLVCELGLYYHLVIYYVCFQSHLVIIFNHFNFTDTVLEFTESVLFPYNEYVPLGLSFFSL